MCTVGSREHNSGMTWSGPGFLASRNLGCPEFLIYHAMALESGVSRKSGVSVFLFSGKISGRESYKSQSYSRGVAVVKFTQEFFRHAAHVSRHQQVLHTDRSKPLTY